MNRFIGGLGARFNKPMQSPKYVTVSDVVNEYRKSQQYDVTNDKLLSKIILWRGDITKLEVDAIVNAANETLLGGGGVDGAIHSAAGPELLDECKGLGGCKTGEAKITKGYRLPAKFVIHTVGPIYRGRKQDKDYLTSCYKNSLNLMHQKNLKSIAFPCISTGIFRYPNIDAAHIALTTVHQWLKKNHDSVEYIVFCLFLQKDVGIYTKAIKELYEHMDFTLEDSTTAREMETECNKRKKDDGYDDRTDLQMISKKADNATGLSIDTDKQVSASDEECDNMPIKQVEDLQKCNDEVETSLSGIAKEENQPLNLSPSEKKQWIEKFNSFEVESAAKPIFEDTEEWLKEKDLQALKFIGGLDISYHKSKRDVASVTLVVLSYPELELLYNDTTIESITVPYIPGYLAYREAEHFHNKVKKVKQTDFSPQVILVDGNGALHPRRYGSAVKVGVDADLPTIGVAKNLMIMEELGIGREKIGEMKEGGCMVDITTNDGEVLGKAVRTTDTSYKPVFISVGHRCSLNSAVRIVLGCCKTRIPEPIKQADHLSKMRLKKIP